MVKKKKIDQKEKKNDKVNDKKIVKCTRFFI